MRVAEREQVQGRSPRTKRRWTAVAAAAIVLLAGVVSASVAGSATGGVDLAATCAVDGPAVESGSVLISRPMLPQITGSDLGIDLSVEATVPDAVNPGQPVPAASDVLFDLDAIAQDVLENRVKPGVVAAGFPELAPSAWVELDLRAVSFSVTHPAGTVPVGDPAASSTFSAASAAWTPGAVTLTLDHLRADSRAPGPPATASLAWTVLDGGAAPPRTLAFDAGAVSFEATVSVGLLFYGSPVVGAVSAPWACVPDAPAPSLGAVAVVSEPVSTSTTASTTSTSVPGSTSTSTSSTSTTSTTWRDAPSIAASACQVSGFDRYGGYTGISVEATGYFRTTEIDGRWWFVDPDGHPFFSQGINHTTFAGTADRFGATPYHDAAVARYGTAENWAAAQVQRMDDWGYNTLGAWSDEILFDHKPYALLLGMTSQNFTTGQMEDLFDPDWAADARATAAAAAAAHGDDPNLLGYWSDNELHFGPDWRQLHLFDSYLSRGASEPGKQALMAFLQERYDTFGAFADDFTTTATDWAALGAPATVTEWTDSGGEATRAAWVGVVAERYFSVTTDAVRDADPNHLVLGARFLSQTTGTPVLEAAARHVDVASFNLYPLRPELIEPLRNADPTYLPVDGGLAAQAAILDKPILISEWSFRAADSGLPNTWPPLFPTLDTQSQRAAAYETYVATLLDTDWVIGQHWFEHADEPPAGRFDGEDSNFGLVDNDDNPYPLLTEVSKTMHDCAYARLDEQSDQTSTTTSLAPDQPSSTEPPTSAVAASPVGSGQSSPTARPVPAAPAFAG